MFLHALPSYLNESEADTVQTELVKSKSRKQTKHFSQSGIKLFKASTDLIKEFQHDCDSGNGTEENNRKKTRMKLNNKYNEIENVEKAKAVAVDSNSILSGKEVDTWSKDVKGEVIRVKKTSNPNTFSIERNGYVSPEVWSGRIKTFII